MARRGRRGRSQRDPYVIASDPLLSDLFTEPLMPSPIARQPVGRDLWSEVEDTRRWHPDSEPDALNFEGIPARVVYDAPRVGTQRAGVSGGARKSRPSRFLSVARGYVPARFEDVKAAVVCARRKERREVIFAKRRFGKGGGKRNWRSGVSCRG